MWAVSGDEQQPTPKRPKPTIQIETETEYLAQGQLPGSLDEQLK
jgi:hypothetical protein